MNYICSLWSMKKCAVKCIGKEGDYAKKQIFNEK